MGRVSGDADSLSPVRATEKSRVRGGLWAVLAVLVALVMGGCIQQAAPAPAEIRAGVPPWDAPRDAISYIRLAGLPELPLDDRSDPWVLTLTISIDGQPVEIPAYVGIDRPRAVQSPVHTHDTSGEVWLEGRGNREITLADFFAVWGVKFTETCLGDACGTITVTADGTAVDDPGARALWGVAALDVSLTTR